MQTITTAHPLLCIALVAGLWHPAAPAQTAIYRCGDTYSERPCNGAANLALHDARTPAQQAQASAVAQRLDQHASQLEKERHILERNAPREPQVFGRAAPAGTPAAAPAANKPKGVKGAKAAPEHFTASAVTPKKGNKAKGAAKKTAPE